MNQLKEGIEKNCYNCVHTDLDAATDEPCVICFSASHWEPIPIGNCGNCEHVEDGSCGVIGCIGFDLWHPIRSCENCYSKNSNKYDEPCISCSCRDRWQLAELDLNAVDYSAKADSGKPRCDLVSPALIEAVGYVRGYGTDKYGDPDNWQTVESSRFMAALIRHLCHCMRDLSSVDEESGLPHLWHVATNVNFLMERVEVRDDQD